jgi:putative transposase
MPWQTFNMLDKRQEFVMRAQRAEQCFSALCLEYGISRKTGYKWVNRGSKQGVTLLADRSRRPKSCKGQLSESETCELIRLKMAHPKWGPKKIRALYEGKHGSAPSLSSCHRVLKRSGQVVTAKRRRVYPAQRLVADSAALAPNDVWTVDFKGWWRLADNKRCEPLTVRDSFSCYILAVEITPSACTEVVKAVFIKLFENHGLPKVIKTDNGVPFAYTRSLLGLTRLSAWWISLGIQLDRSRPAHPQDNGAHERMHRDIKAELAAYIQPDSDAQQMACDLWREEFNTVRPHEKLGLRTPAKVFCKSPRKYQPQSLQYPTGFITRRISPVGLLRIQSASFFVSASLAGWDVGLRQVSPSKMEVWFAHLLAGHINFDTLAFLGTPSRASEGQRIDA